MSKKIYKMLLILILSLILWLLATGKTFAAYVEHTIQNEVEQTNTTWKVTYGIYKKQDDVDFDAATGITTVYLESEDSFDIWLPNELECIEGDKEDVKYPILYFMSTPEDVGLRSSNYRMSYYYDFPDAGTANVKCPCESSNTEETLYCMIRGVGRLTDEGKEATIKKDMGYWAGYYLLPYQEAKLSSDVLNFTYKIIGFPDNGVKIRVNFTGKTNKPKYIAIGGKSNPITILQMVSKDYICQSKNEKIETVYGKEFKVVHGIDNYGNVGKAIRTEYLINNNKKVFDGVQKALDYLMEPNKGVSLEVETTREYLSNILR